MRHQVFGKKLSRDLGARKALLNNLASSLLLRGKVTTTLSKAKFARPHIDKMVTLAKRNRLPANRALASYLTEASFRKLIYEIGPGFGSRNGGYTRIIKLPRRRGDSAPMARVELLEPDQSLVRKPEAKKVKKQPRLTKTISTKRKKTTAKPKK